jgi:hypothetical protein
MRISESKFSFSCLTIANYNNERFHAWTWRYQEGVGAGCGTCSQPYSARWNIYPSVFGGHLACMIIHREGILCLVLKARVGGKLYQPIVAIWSLPLFIAGVRRTLPPSCNALSFTNILSWWLCSAAAGVF